MEHTKFKNILLFFSIKLNKDINAYKLADMIQRKIGIMPNIIFLRIKILTT